MITILKMSASHAFQLQIRMLKSCSRLSNIGPVIPYSVFHLYCTPKEEYSPSHAPYPLCVPVKKSRLSNSSVQMLLMHTIFSQTPCCNLWLAVNSILATCGIMSISCRNSSKNLVWTSQNFLLPYITVEEYCYEFVNIVSKICIYYLFLNYNI